MPGRGRDPLLRPRQAPVSRDQQPAAIPQPQPPSKHPGKHGHRPRANPALAGVHKQMRLRDSGLNLGVKMEQAFESRSLCDVLSAWRAVMDLGPLFRDKITGSAGNSSQLCDLIW